MGAIDDLIGIGMLVLVVGGGYYIVTSPSFAAPIMTPVSTRTPKPGRMVGVTMPTMTGGGGGASLGQPGGGNDKFGVKMIYASKTGGPQWFLNGTSGIYNSGNKIVSNSDGSFSNSGSNVRNEVCTPGFTRDSFGNPDHNAMAARGYMWKPTDWNNFEMTGYYSKGGSACASGAGQSSHQEHVMKGGVNDGHGCGPHSCQATNYHVNIYPTGRIRLERDLCHNTGYQANAQESTSSALASAMNSGHYYGYKTITRNVGGAVQIEAWLDANATNNWQKIFSGSDHGQMGCRGQCCCTGCNCNRPVTWGGPCTNFRFDGMCLKWKWLSLREIA